MTSNLYAIYSRDPAEFYRFVNKIEATGGGDDAEDVMGGLEAALTKLTWRDPDIGTKVLLNTTYMINDQV